MRVLPPPCCWRACRPPVTRADDLTTLSGQTFHNVQPLRVEPDGVTWQYAEGVAKVDFSDRPEKVRAARP